MEVTSRMNRIDELDLQAYKRGVGDGRRSVVLKIMNWWLDNTAPRLHIRQQFLDWIKAELGVLAKRCVRCSKWKPETEFNRSAHNRDGRLGACRECMRAYKLSYYHATEKTAEKKAKRAEKAKRAWQKLKHDPERYRRWLEERRRYRKERNIAQRRAA